MRKDRPARLTNRRIFQNSRRSRRFRDSRARVRSWRAACGDSQLRKVARGMRGVTDGNAGEIPQLHNGAIKYRSRQRSVRDLCLKTSFNPSRSIRASKCPAFGTVAFAVASRLNVTLLPFPSTATALPPGRPSRSPSISRPKAIVQSRRCQTVDSELNRLLQCERLGQSRGSPSG